MDTTTPARSHALRGAVTRLPIVFEENVGQAAKGVRWLVTKPSAVVWFFDDHVVFHFPVPNAEGRDTKVLRAPDGDVLSRWMKPDRRVKSGSIRMDVGAVPRSGGPESEKPLETTGRFATCAGSGRFALAAGIVYRSVAPGVDLRFYDGGGRLRYDVVVAPGADLSGFRLRFPDALVHADETGNLAALGVDGGVWHSAPRCFIQRKDGGRDEVSGRFVAHANHGVGFQVAAPQSAPLTIDPELFFGSHLTMEQGQGALMDASGVSCDIAFSTPWLPEGSTDLCTVRRYDCTNPVAPTLVYVWSLRANRVMDIASAGPRLFVLAKDAQDIVIPADAFDTAAVVNRYTIVRIEQDGAPSRATRFRFLAAAIAVDPADPAGGVYIGAGYTGGYDDTTQYGPAIRAPIWYDTILVKLDADLRQRPYLTSLGGAAPRWSSTQMRDMCVTNGELYVVGSTDVDDYAIAGTMLTGDPPFPAEPGGRRVFITKLDASGAVAFSGLVGSGDTGAFAGAVAAAPDGTCAFSALVGNTIEDANAWLVDGNQLLFRLSADGTQVLYVRDYGPSYPPREGVAGVAADATGAVWACGHTRLTGRATPDAAQAQIGGGAWDGFLSRIDPFGGEDYYTYLGGSADDRLWRVVYAGQAVYALGSTSSADLPTRGTGIQGAADSPDLFLAIFKERPVEVTLTTSCSASEVVAAELFTYTVVVTNLGAEALEGITIDDVVEPAGVQVTLPQGWQRQDGRLFVEGVVLGAGASVTYTLEAIAFEPFCYSNRAVATRLGVQIAEASVGKPCVMPTADTMPQIIVTLDDDSDSPLLASYTGANPVTVTVALTNISGRPVGGVRLHHSSSGRAVEFRRILPGDFTIENAFPAASWDQATGVLDRLVSEYEARLPTISPGHTVRVIALSQPIKNGVYATTARVSVSGYPDAGSQVTRAFTMGPVADLRLALAVTHIPAGPGVPLQQFDITVRRAAGDAGEAAPDLMLHCELRVPHGADLPPATLSVALRRTAEGPGGDTWLASGLVHGLQATSTMVLSFSATLDIASLVASVEGPINTPPAPASWP